MSVSMKSNRRALLSQLDNRWLVAGLAATGAGGVMLANPESADASIVYSGIVNINIPSTTAGVYLNLVTGVFNASPGAVPGWDVNPWSSSGLGLFNPTAPSGGVYVNLTSGGTHALNLAPGTPINASSLYGSNSSAAGADQAQWNLGSCNNLIGIRLQNEANANQIHYGWMRVCLDGTAGNQPRSIQEYAWENVAGTSIGAGNTVPEPTSLGLLALGAAGILLRRRSSN